MENSDVFKVLKILRNFYELSYCFTRLQVHINEVGVATLNTGWPGA